MYFPAPTRLWASSLLFTLVSFVTLAIATPTAIEKSPQFGKQITFTVPSLQLPSAQSCGKYRPTDPCPPRPGVPLSAQGLRFGFLTDPYSWMTQRIPNGEKTTYTITCETTGGSPEARHVADMVKDFKERADWLADFSFWTCSTVRTMGTASINFCRGEGEVFGAAYHSFVVAEGVKRMIEGCEWNGKVGGSFRMRYGDWEPYFAVFHS
ncbi:hypothetical protein BJ508DRAFT_312154 [Ascobolus immersus RN42]|uniref:Ecp2 effector protein domain-containing protein n=1 Tax=Ascobolus immersus RN42 TaxID=1160509 RepID=A0A3N4HN44_ASCIM|nr:hypothetical protein BJ508DRAFT_312154 [Ascobolus immersus RN42]